MTACIRPDAAMPAGAMSRSAPVADLAAYERWPELLADVDAVVHLAARVHVMRDRSADPLSEFRKVNVHAAAALAAQAARAGVRRFLYVSSIKVNGEATPVGEFHADDPPGYVDPYGQSKWEAEQSLEEVAAAAGMDWLVVRPTLVYGPGVQGNFLSLLRCVHRGLPLPLGRVRNRRSLVSVYNLVDLLARAIDHPAAAGQRLLVKDAEDVSIGELVVRMALAFDRAPRLLLSRPLFCPIRPSCCARKASRNGCSGLLSSTRINRRSLAMAPPVSLDCALTRTCSWFEATSAAGKGP